MFENEKNSQLDAIRKAIYSISHAIFSSNEKDKKYFLGKGVDCEDIVKKKCGSIKPCIHGSDAHSEEKLFSPDNDLFCWIKADPTFEGLKQIIYEPESRVYIGRNYPQHTLNTIDTIKFNIPNNSTVMNHTFCFQSQNKDYYLSPYLNCFIGGRGAGKSTILNFLGIRSINPDSSKSFWQNLEPNGFDTNNSAHFQVVGTEHFEFIGQSEIDKFAKDKVIFTQAIYDRTKQYSENSFREYEEDILKFQKNLDSIISTIFELKLVENNRINKEKEKRTLEKSMEILNNDEYKNNVSEIQNNAKKLENLKTFRINFLELRDILEKIIKENNNVSNINILNPTLYKVQEQVLIKIQDAVNISNNIDLNQAISTEDDLIKLIEILESKNKIMLSSANLSHENIEQMKSAPQKLTTLNKELDIIKSSIIEKKNKIKNYQDFYDKLKEIKNNFENDLSNLLKPLQDKLEQQ